MLDSWLKWKVQENMHKKEALMEVFVQGFGDALAKLGSIGVAAEGINAFVQQGFEDRFN